MTDTAPRTPENIQATAIAPMLSVRRGAKAIEFYQAAFGAKELFRIDSETGEVVARLKLRRTAAFSFRLHQRPDDVGIQIALRVRR